MRKLCYQVGLIAGMLMFASCSSDETSVKEGVAADGSTAGQNDELTAGLEAPSTPTADTNQDMMTGDGMKNAATDKTSASKGQDKVKVNAQYLNVRQGPGTSFPVVRILKKGETVEALENKGIWVKIAENEFVSSKFVSQP